MKIIIIGIPRSGTTLLASMLGGHPDISMMDECHTNDFEKQIGTKIIGNKIACDGMVCSFYRKSFPVLGSIVNRIINRFSRKQIYRLFPAYHYSIKDLIILNCKFIIIHRNKEDVILSNIKRGGMGSFAAKIKYKLGYEVIDKIKNNYIEVSYESLLKHPEFELLEICKFLNISKDVKKMKDAAKFNNRYNKPLEMSKQK